MTEKGLIIFAHSRTLTVVMFIIATAMCIVALSQGSIPEFSHEDRAIFTSPDRWIAGSGLSFAINILIYAASAVALSFFCNNYNPFRLSSSVSATLFLVFILGIPSVIERFYSGTYILGIVVLCIILTLSEYQDKSKMRRVFLTFFILSTASLADYTILLYVPVFILGTAQMRIFSGRTIVAILLGLITPFWILGGFGVLNDITLRLPQMESIFKSFSSQEVVPFIVAGVIIFFFSVLLLMANFIKLVGYNARIRSANGLMTVTLFATLVYTVIDYSNLPTYLPLMMWGAAFQAGHLIMSRNGQRTYLAVAGIVLLFLYLFIWNIAV